MKNGALSGIVFVVAAICFCREAAALDWGSALGKLGLSKKTSINSTPAAEALKEALRIGIDKAIDGVGRTNGFLNDAGLRIGLPKEMAAAEKLLRRTPVAPKLDEWSLSMNRAAEAAAPHAKEIFVQAIAAMSIEDAEKILKSGDAAATQYFERATRPELAQKLKPVIAAKMSQYDATRQYQDLAARIRQLPMLSQWKGVNIEDYVTEKTLDGLFKRLGEEEKAIRRDPAARVTPILKEAFSRLG